MDRWKYFELDRIALLREEGRELLGKELFWEEKGTKEAFQTNGKD